VDNAEIARTLDAYAALLDLAGAGHWSIRAYRRAADLVRATPAPVEELVRTMPLAVTNARRGRATTADVLNTRPLAEILRR
jgi:DNA polymerase/3'-5' exonuclease PolX